MPAKRFIHLKAHPHYLHLNVSLHSCHPSLSNPPLPPPLRAAHLLTPPPHSHSDLRAYRRSNADIASLSAKTDLSARQIQSWLRRRQKFADFASKPQIIDKFKESFWRLCFYLFIFAYGSITLWNKPWAWSRRLLWSGWPKHPLEESIRYSLGLIKILLLAVKYL